MRTKIISIKFADMIILAGGTNILQRSVIILEEEIKEYGMKTNIRKTKIMKVNNRKNLKVRKNEGRIKNVKNYRYMGSMIKRGLEEHKEIKGRIVMAMKGISKRKLLCSKSWQLRKILAKN